MMRSKCGLLLLLAAGIGACGGDPTDSFREEGEKIVTDPTVVFVDEGANVFVVAQLQDNQGNQLATNFEATPLDPSKVSVVRDTAFLETTNGQTLKTRERFIVTGVSAGATAFELTGGSVKDTITVNVKPTSLPATFSNAAPVSNEIVTLTAPGYNFLPGTTVNVGIDTAVVLSVGSELKFLPIPGSTGPVTVTGAAIGFLPETPLTLTSTESITVGPPAAIAGTDAPGTAPTIPLPDVGNTSAVIDATPFGASVCGGNSGVPCQLYKISLPTDTSFTATMRWNNKTDLGIYVMTADGSTDTDQACDDFGNQTDPNNPGGIESCTITLTAGDYLIGAVNFGPFYDPPDPAPDWVAVEVSLP